MLSAINMGCPERRAYSSLAICGLGGSVLADRAEEPPLASEIRDPSGRYRCEALVDLGFYPNYSVEVGDVDGDGRMEVAALSTRADLLKVVDLRGRVVLERRLRNSGCWGTATLALADVDGDGRDEVIVPDGPPGDARVVAIDQEGEVVREARVPGAVADDYGLAVPLIAAFERGDGSLGICVAVAGGLVLALNSDFEPLWEVRGLRKDFGHELYVAKVPEGDLVAFVTVDHIRYSSPTVEGELLVVSSEGELLMRKRVRDLVDDTHFDDVAIADFRGAGQLEVLVEKGILMDMEGRVIWDRSALFDHGQWVAHMPNPLGPGRLAFISELWGYEGKSRMLDPHGNTLWMLGKRRHTAIDQAAYPGYVAAPTRAHAIDWSGTGEYEVVLGEQIVKRRGAPRLDVTHELKLFVFSPLGELLAEVPFVDTRRSDFFYNGEVHSRVADVDGDGRLEYVFPRQDGRVMVIGRGP